MERRKNALCDYICHKYFAEIVIISYDFLKVMLVYLV
jgi:hypothetical protein